MNIIKTNTTQAEQQNLRQLTKELYELCFDDSAEFVDFYFRRRYTDENNFALLHNGTLAAALQAIPYKMTFFGKAINIAYLSAICTRPDLRNKGLMTQLLTSTHKQLFSTDVYVAALIPAELWLFDVYKKYGFETLFYRSQKQICASILSGHQNYKIHDFASFDKDRIFNYFDAEMHKRNCCIQHSRHNFTAVCEDIYNSEGVILIAEHENKISGIIFAIKINDEIAVIEHFADNQYISNTLLKKLSQKLQTDSFVGFDFPRKNNGTPFGMMRIICVEKMLQLYASTHPRCKQNILVNDKHIVENSGCYTIANSHCTKLPLTDEKNAWNISQLTHFIFARQMPYMSLMMNE